MPIDRKCLICGTSFTTCPSLDKKYCGRKCFYDSRRKPAEELATRYRTANVGRGHPLTLNAETINEHRVILWDKIGPGPHPCHHCGRRLDWLVGASTIAGAIVVDHLDRDSLNNDPDNLVPSCHACNLLNCDRAVRDDEAFRVIAKGTRLRGERRNCEHCDGSFVAWPEKNPRKGRFCSRSCARSGPRKPRGT